jgi:hypothetical protein
VFQGRCNSLAHCDHLRSIRVMAALGLGRAKIFPFLVGVEIFGHWQPRVILQHSKLLGHRSKAIL